MSQIESTFSLREMAKYAGIKTCTADRFFRSRGIEPVKRVGFCRLWNQDALNRLLEHRKALQVIRFNEYPSGVVEGATA